MLLTNIPKTLAPTSLPSHLTASSLNLSSPDHKTLLKKRTWLQNYKPLLPRRLTHDPSPATFVFAQEEAGTAVCISPNGVLLTCSHCIAETREELDWGEVHWLLFGSPEGKGEVVGAKTVAWDGRRDLAVMVIVRSNFTAPYPHLVLSPTAPRAGSQLICIGHPGSEDLETSIPGVQTNYDTLVLSMGAYRGLAEGQDPQDNSNIGALMHDCWTYWGHSGAPLVGRRGGLLVGVHSSWDSETGMRRGVGWEALRSFLGELESSIGSKGEGAIPEGWIWVARG